MKPRAPHFLLFSETRSTTSGCASDKGPAEPAGAVGYWRFVLQSEDGQVELDVTDREGTASEERLNLLAIVRGLEALPAPSRVTVVTRSGWIRRGLRFGLEQWRENHWQWERFGHLAPVKNADLWRRVDHALRFHEVECRALRVDAVRDDLSGPHFGGVPRPTRAAVTGTAGAPGGVRPASRPSRPRRADHILLRALRHLFGWCGLCRRGPSPVMAAH
jgi:ribonuclease HI